MAWENWAILCLHLNAGTFFKKKKFPELATLPFSNVTYPHIYRVRGDFIVGPLP